MRDSIRFTLSAAVSAVALAGSAVPAFAQSATEVKAQDIIVTARKRAESLQDAPVAISVVSAQKLNQNALTSLTDVASIAGGGVIIAQAGVTTTLSIRGISSDSTNIGFDQTVGIVIDGVFYDKARWVNQGFMDMSQVEILKGPQALYFGRSAVAGAINITTAGPTDKFEAAATVGYETEGREIYTEGFVSGPITDTLGGRIAVRLSDSEGPWNNKALSLPDKRFGATNDKSARVTLDWKPTDQFEATLKLQAGLLKDEGMQPYTQLFQCRGPGVANPFVVTGIPGNVGIEPFPTQDDCKLNKNVDVNTAPPGVAIRDPYSRQESLSGSLKMAYKADNYTLTSVTGWNRYEWGYATGLISSGGLITASEDETNRAFSQELRLDTDFDGPLNVLFGGNFQDAKFFHANANQLFLPPPDPADGRNISHTHFSNQDGTSWSIFGEVSYDITPKLQAAAGVRYSDESKKSRFVVDYVNPGQFFFFLPQGTIITDDYDDDATSPQFTLTYKATPDLTAYASYRTGFLPGGFSHGGTPQFGLSPSDFTFESQKAKGFEVGLKSYLFDRKVAANLAAYHYKYTDLQTSIYLPASAAFITGNAGDAETTGVEAEVSWSVTPEFSLNGNLNYNKGEFDNARGPCYTAQSAAQGCDPVTIDQDLSGKPLPRAPEWTAQLGADYRRPIQNFVFSAGANANYSDKYQLEPTANPDLVQDSFVRVDANLGIETADGHWKAAFIGRNLTNEPIAVFGATRGFTFDNLAVIQRLREMRFQLTYRY